MWLLSDFQAHCAPLLAEDPWSHLRSLNLIHSGHEGGSFGIWMDSRTSQLHRQVPGLVVRCWRVPNHMDCSGRMEEEACLILESSCQFLLILFLLLGGLLHE